MRDLVLIGLLAGLPGLVLSFGIWLLVHDRGTGTATSSEVSRRARRSLARAGPMCMIGSSGLLLLILACWRLVVERAAIGAVWLACGAVLLLIGFGAGVGAKGRERAYVIGGAAVLVPVWLAVAGLLVKAVMD